MRLPVYMDNHATTPVDPLVLESMLPYFTTHFGNAASRQHEYGWTADQGVETARHQVATLIGATAQEIIFTSGGSESDNQALVGIFESYGGPGAHFISTPVEHKAILETLKYLESRGAKVTLVPVDREGRVKPKDIEAAITPQTKLISVIFGNNEIGTINPIAEIGAIAERHGVVFHTDAVQAAGRLPIDVNTLKVDLLSLASHKIYGPKGVGALFIKRKQPRLKLGPILRGGGHERGLRSGTLNVPGIVGFGKACELAQQKLSTEPVRLMVLRDQMIKAFQKIQNSHINGPIDNRLPQNVSITLGGIRAHRVISTLKDLAISTGSACSSQSVEPSYVLKAIGLSDEEAVSTIRFGLGRFTTQDEVEYCISSFLKGIEALRNSPS